MPSERGMPYALHGAPMPYAAADDAEIGRRAACPIGIPAWFRRYAADHAPYIARACSTWRRVQTASGMVWRVWRAADLPAGSMPRRHTGMPADHAADHAPPICRARTRENARERGRERAADASERAADAHESAW